jgi:uncharacterized protein (TIGR02271 family)
MIQTHARVLGRDGLRGTIERVDRPGPGAEARVVVQLDDGRQVVLPAALLAPRDDGGYDLPLGAADLEPAGPAAVIPVVAEEVEVRKRRVETGRVRVTKVVTEREEVVDEPLLREEVDVRRVAVNRVVDGPVPVRQEGDTMIVPLLEEVLVVEKRLMLKDELHITKTQVTERRPERVTLRSEEVRVDRVADPGRPQTDA